MGGKASAPPTPDYASLIPIQAQSNINQFLAALQSSRVNSITPFGSQTWTRTPLTSGALPAPTSSLGGLGGWSGPGSAVGQTGDLLSQFNQSAPSPGNENMPWISSGSGESDQTWYNPSTGQSRDTSSVADQPQQGGSGLYDYQPAYGNAPQDQWTLTQSFSPEQQALYESQVQNSLGMQGIASGLLGNLQQTLGTPLNTRSMLGNFQAPNPIALGLRDPLSAVTPINVGNAPGVSASQGNVPGAIDPGITYNYTGGTRDAAERALYSRQLAFVQPQLDIQRENLRQQLLAGGFNPTNAAYQRAMSGLDLQQGATQAAARDAAIAFGGNEAMQELQRGLTVPSFRASEAGRIQSGSLANAQIATQAAMEQARLASQQNALRAQTALQQQQMLVQGALGSNAQSMQLANQLFGQGLQGQQFNLGANLQGIGLSEQDRARQLNEFNALRTGQPVQTPGVPGQFSTPQLPGIDILGSANQQYQNALAGVNAENAARGNFTSGLMGLLGSGAMAYALAGSDRRLKEHIEFLYEGRGGLRWYRFEYKPEFKDRFGHGPFIGVMADELPEDLQAAVVVGEDGYQRVNYAKLWPLTVH